MSLRQVLMVVTAADELPLRDGSSQPTGYWASEVLEPYDTLTAGGYDVVVATPGGRSPTPDPRSVSQEGMQARVDAVPGLGTPAPLSAQEDGAVFAAVVLPGGHGPMVDLCGNQHLGRILREAVAADVPIAAICHGPAGLLSARQGLDASWPFAGRRMTAFSNAEEGDLGPKLEWSLEDELAGSGAKLELAAEPLSAHVVVDGLLVTGQNPASARPAAEALLGLLA